MIAFVHINKTAGTNLKYILRRSFGNRHCDVRIWPKQTKEEREVDKRVVSKQDILKSKWIYPRLKSISGHLVTSYSDLKELDDIRFYTFVREPIARTISHYQFMFKNPNFNESFEEWISKPHYRNVQTRKIAGVEKAEEAISIIDQHYGFVGLQEKYDESLLLLKHWVNEPSFNVHYSSMNVANKKPKGDEILKDEKLLNLAKEANAEDLKVYSHVLKNIYPKQLEQYGETLADDLKAYQAINANYHDKRSTKGKIARGLYWLFLPLISHGKYF